MVVGRPILLALEDIDGGPSFLEKALRFLEKYGKLWYQFFVFFYFSYSKPSAFFLCKLKPFLFLLFRNNFFFFLLGTNLCYFFPQIQLISFPFQVLYMCVCVNYFVSFQMTPMLVELGRCHIFLVGLYIRLPVNDLCKKYKKHGKMVFEWLMTWFLVFLKLHLCINNK